MGLTTSTQAGFDERADALHGTLKVLRSDVRHVSNQKEQTLAGFHERQRIVTTLHSNPLESHSISNKWVTKN